MKNLLSLLLWLISMLSSTHSYAHTSGASFASLRAIDSETVTASFDFDLRDLNQLLQLDRNVDGVLTWSEIDSSESAIEELVRARSRLHTSEDCKIVDRSPVALADHGDGPFVRIALSYRCTRADSGLKIDYSAWFDFDPGHRALIEYTDVDGNTTQSVLSTTTAQWQVAETTPMRLRRFLMEGAFHLVTGYDHLAFLGVLLLALARRRGVEAAAPLRSMLKRALIVITAFTIAHSVTLALAATGKLLLPTKPVEVTIAASVMLTAVLNLWRGAGNHGWKLAFAFGLVHGLGFAGALAEMASDSIDLFALAAFNVGIEVAQIVIAAVAVPLVWISFRDARNERIGLPVASMSIAVVAGFWVVARLGA